MLFSDHWKAVEDAVSDKIIKDTCDIINFNKTLKLNEICIHYISVHNGSDSNCTSRYMIFVPFGEYSKMYYENNFPYLFIKVFKISVSEDFMKWIFYTTRANKIPVIIGKVNSEISGAWELCHGDKNIVTSTNINTNTSTTANLNVNEIEEQTSFLGWLYERHPIDPNFKLCIKNPMISQVPFPITEQNFVITFNYP